MGGGGNMKLNVEGFVKKKKRGGGSYGNFF